MFDEFSGKDLNDIPRSRPRGSSEETEEEEIVELNTPIYPDINDKSYYKVIVEAGEGTERPSKLDSVSLEQCSSDSTSVKLLDLQTEQTHLRNLIISMKKNEVSELFFSETSMKVKLLDWISIQDILQDGSIIKTIKQKGLGYDHIDYKDDVKANIKIYQGDTIYLETEAEYSCEVPFIPTGLFEVFKSMKLLEQATIKVKEDCYRKKFFGFPEVTGEVLIDIAVQDLKKVEDMYLDGSFYKKHVVEGEGKNLPNPNALVRIFYKLEIAGKAVINNFESEVLSIRMDEDEVPSLWTHCLRQMKEGDVVKVECNMMGLHSHYLNDGLNPKYNYETYQIPDIHSCVFFISLVSFDMGKVNYNMTHEDRVVEANRIKDAGNKLFKINRFDKALEKYESANSSLEPITDCPPILRPPHLLLYGNITLCYLKMEKYHEAETYARKILDFNPNDIKALYRRALARIQLQNYDAASQDLKTAKSVCEEKSDKEMLAAVNKEISRINSLTKDSRIKEKAIYRNLFSN